MDVFEIPLVSVGSLRHGHTVMGAVPGSVNAVSMIDEKTPAVVDEDFELCRLATGDTSEAVILLPIGSEYVGEPDGAYLGTEAYGGVGAAVIPVAGEECDGDSVGQRTVELASDALAAEGIAVRENPSGLVTVRRAVVKSENWMVKVDKIAVGFNAECRRRLHTDGDRRDDVA